MDEKVSIIIPVYNTAAYINKCLNSIINQTYSNLEIILINDGSIDESVEICDNYKEKDKRVKVIHKKNAGVSSARNTGLKIATGHWISFIDSDDYITEDAISKMVKIAHDYNSHIVDFNYYKSIGDRPIKLVINKRNRKLTSEKYLKNILTYKSQVSLFPKLFNKEILLDLCFDESLSIGEDLIFNLNILVNNPNLEIYTSTDFIYFYTIRTTSAMHNDDLSSKYDILTESANKLLNDQKLHKKYHSELAAFNLINIYFKTLKSDIYINDLEYSKIRDIIKYIPICRNNLVFKFKLLLWSFLLSRNMGNLFIKLRKIIFPIY